MPGAMHWQRIGKVAPKGRLSSKKPPASLPGALAGCLLKGAQAAHPLASASGLYPTQA